MGKPLPLRLRRLWNAVHILLRTAASLVWVSWSQGVKGQPRWGPTVCSTGTTGRKEAGPLEASDESVISGVGGSVCRKPGQQPCLGRGSTAPSQLSTRSPPALGTLQNQSLANLTRAHSLQHSPPGPWNTISVPTAGLSLACRQDFLPSTSRGKSSQETPHLTRHTIHPLTSS